MLDVGTAPEYVAGLTVFGDHADPSLCYVLADTPRLVADPDPRLLLTLYRSLEFDAQGGLLHLETVLGPTESQTAAVEAHLTERGRPALLGRPSWVAGRVSVIGWTSGDVPTAQRVDVGTPSLLGDPHAVVAARLEPSIAALMRAALDGDSLPVAIIFELSYLGLAGPLGVRASANVRGIHERLAVEGALTVPVGRARLAATWDELASEGLIEIDIVDESGDVTSTRSETLRRIGSDLVTSLFDPVPPPSAPPLLDGRPVAPIELSFTLRARREELATSVRWDFTERRTRSHVHHAAASLIGLLGDSNPTRHIVLVDLDDLTDRPERFRVHVNVPLRDAGLIAVDVELALADGGPVVAAASFDDDRPQADVDVELGERRTVWYRCRGHFDPDLVEHDAVETDWVETDARVLLVSPIETFGRVRTVTVWLGAGELDWLDHVEVAVEGATRPAAASKLDDTRRLVNIPIGLATSTPTVTAVWHGRHPEPTLEADPLPVPLDDLVILDSPFAPSIGVLVVPRLPSSAGDVVVEVRKVNDDFVSTQMLEWIAPDREPRRAELRRPLGADATYEYRVTSIDAGGPTIGDWQATDEATLVLGSHEPVAIHVTTVILLGGGPVERGSILVVARLDADAEHVRALLDGTTERAELRLVAPVGSVPLVTITEFFEDGTSWTMHADGSRDAVVVPPASHRDTAGGDGGHTPPDLDAADPPPDVPRDVPPVEDDLNSPGGPPVPADE